jgi:phosphate uptake regulator
MSQTKHISDNQKRKTYELYIIAWVCVEAMERELGYRTVQSTGRGSFIMSLPKKWAQETEIDKGSQIAIKIMADKSLVLIPRKLEEKRNAKSEILKEYFIEINQRSDTESVCRRLTSLYATGAELVHLSFKDVDQIKEFKATVTSLVRNLLLGTEIVEETTEEMSLQVLINHPELPIEKAITRMANLSISAHKDSIVALSNLERDWLSYIYKKRMDVERLNLYVVRQLKYGIEHNLFGDWGFTTSKEFLGYRLVANDIKNIAGNAHNMGKNIMTLRRLIDDKLLFLKDIIDEEVYNQIDSFNSLTQQLFKESLDSLFTRDYVKADTILSRLESFLMLENDLITLLLNKKIDPNLLSIYRLVLDNTRKIVEYSKEIAEVTLNRTVEDISVQAQS